MKTFNFDLGKDKFVGDYYDDIVRIINQYNYVKIVAPTECGKTEFVKRFAYNVKVNIIQPTNAICLNKFRDDYSKKYFERYGVAPKYDSIRIVGTQTSIFELDATTSNVMVVDQAVKHFDEFDGSIVFLDECHSVNEGTYRQAYLTLIRKLRSSKCKLVTMTGTPNNEEMFIGEPDAVIYMTTENRTPVDIVSCFWNQVGVNIRHILNSTNYEHYLIYTNHHFKRIVSNIKDYSPVLIHNDFTRKDSPEYKVIVDDGNIKDYPIIMFTQLMNAGVDLTYDAPTHMICVVQDGDIDCASVLQALGRIRKRNLQYYNIHYTILVVGATETEDDNLTAEETLYIKSKCGEFDFLKLQNKNYIEWNGDRYVINLEFYQMVRQMEENIRGYKEELLLKLKDAGYKVNLLRHFDIDPKIKDKRESHEGDSRMFTENAEAILNIIDNDRYYDYFVSTLDEPKYEDRIIYCNSTPYVKQCAKLYKKIKECSSSKIDLSGCGDLSLEKLEEINTFVRLSNNENFGQFLDMSEGDFKLKYKNDIPEGMLDKLWTRISNYKSIAGSYEKTECEYREPVTDWFNFIPVIFDDNRIISIKMKNGGKKGDRKLKGEGGKIGGQNGSPKKSYTLYKDGLYYCTFDSAQEAADYFGISISKFSKCKDSLSVGDLELVADDDELERYSQIIG